ncbi:MAG: DASS family sodium-coupled anion symporter [Actinobacteria bacterium]|nr:DASS family sodium-coupled anion symporter [Actinomycetota bacterium]
MYSIERMARRARLVVTSRRRLGLVLGAVAFAIPFVVDFPDLSEPGHRAMAVFLLAIVFWVTEAIPLFATAALVMFLLIVLISDQALWSLPGGYEAPPFSSIYGALAHPVLMLFLGGFFLANGAARFGLDRSLARVVLRPFGDSPKMILLGVMAVAATFSMFMSNTATTATLVAVILPVIASLEPGDRLRVALALAIPIAANIGGIGTPVGTPPNAIALAALTDAGFEIGFLRWMAMAVPLAALLVIGAWLLLVRAFPPSCASVSIRIDAEFDRSPAAWVFYATFAATVALWLTEPLHGIPATIVGFVPVVVLLGTGVFKARDLQAIQWHILWLVAGGLALGLGVTSTGLDRWLIGLVGWDALPGWLIVALLALVATAMSTVISNSAAANLLMPIGLTLAMSDAVAVDPIRVGFMIAIGASLAMALPISTPPNAIAYSTGTVSTGDMLRTGLVIGVVGLVMFLGVGPVLWRLLGVS